ncbi:spondin-1-like [Biomphalaria glabrata]|uniref:Spondin-1-like n=1 Tax=Biomphalaria glabrata TaxID=6526 RepID=A0A9W2ZFC1_BIOGL|nr:spondin-1-like [Biomphalaria glabrata]
MNPWSKWQCVPTCSEHQQSRARTCNETLAKMEESSCNDAHAEKETRAYSCYMKRCPTDCLIKQWGEDCAQSCEKCLDDCDKFTGHCYRCEPGFKGFTTACQTAEYDYEKSIIMGTVGVILLFLLTFFCL